MESHVYFGDKKMYKTYNIIGNTKDESWIGRTEPHQQKYGQYFYCYTKGLRGFTFYQDVKVHKAGWYLLRCNGFSTANSSENITTNGKPLANLFITVLNADGKPINTQQLLSTASVRLMPRRLARQTKEPVSDVPSSRESMRTRCRYVLTKPRMGMKYQTITPLRSA